MIARDSLLGPPLVTLGIAVFNGGSDLSLALSSLRGQDYACLEFLICDDGSTDGSLELCREFAASDDRVRLIENPRRLGIVGNYNQIIAEARGEYLVFADQDDRRAPTFVSRCAEVLQAHSETVLCHSHTGVVWPGIGGELYHVNRLDSVDAQTSVTSRYWNFLRHYSDTTIYGLIRTDALRRTGGWRTTLGSSNRLLFELLLLGPFRQVPEVLYFYTATGLTRRPSPAEEYGRQNAGARLPRHHVPFMILAGGQTNDILRSQRSILEKAVLVVVLWIDVAMVNFGKAVYRFLSRVTGRRLPMVIRRWCERLVHSTSDIDFVVRPEEDPEFYPTDWPLRAG